MKSVKSSVDILEGLSTGFNMDVSAPHLIDKWITGHSRPCSCCGTFMLFFFAPHALGCRRNLWRDLIILVPLRTAVLQLPSKSYVHRRERS
jgi:hypothetical protein